MEKRGSNSPLSPKRAGDFRCFRCRRYFTSKDGNWIKWEHMEVHLCHSCERDTRGLVQRSAG